MAKKTVEEITEQPPVEEITEQPPVEEITEQPPVEEITEQGSFLVAVNFIKCDDIEYKPGEPFPIDHPEAERLFKLGAVKEG